MIKKYAIVLITFSSFMGCTSTSDVQALSNGTFMISAKSFNLKKNNQGAVSKSINQSFREAKEFCAGHLPGGTAQIVSSEQGNGIGEAALIFKCIR